MAYSNETGLPSVTDIIKPWIDTRWFTKESADRGSQVHDRVGNYLLRRMTPGFNPEYEPYFQSFMDFYPRVKEVLLVEERLADHDLGFCGQPDLACIFEDGITTLIDWKTAVATYKYWQIQLGGYAILLETQKNIKINKVMSVRLRREYSKKPLVDVYCLQEAKLLFTNQLRLYKHFN